jgi:cell division protein FtsB
MKKRITIENGMRIRILAGIAVVALLWVFFFDSHSLMRRLQWTHEVASLSRENDALREEIADIERRLKRSSDPAVVEKIAREQYGMRRPGETVYRVEPR